MEADSAGKGGAGGGGRQACVCVCGRVCECTAKTNKMTIPDGPIFYRIPQTKQDNMIFGDLYHVIWTCHYLRAWHDGISGLVNCYKVLQCRVTMMDWVIWHLL